MINVLVDGRVYAHTVIPLTESRESPWYQLYRHSRRFDKL